MVQNGIYSIDDVRQFEDMNPLPGGKGAKHYHQSNMIEVGEKPEPAPAPKPQLPPALEPEPEDDEDEGDGDAERMLTGHRAALTDAYARVLRVESDKAGRALKRGELEGWAHSFYDEHEEHVAAVLSPLLEGIAAGYGPVDGERIQGQAAELAGRHVTHSLRDIARHEGAVFDQWTDRRPADSADEALQYLRGEYHAG